MKAESGETSQRPHAALKLGFQVQGFQTPFPVDMFYRSWKHSEGQVSLIQEILKNSDVFNFAEHRHHAVAVEVLKVQPELVRRSLKILNSEIQEVSSFTI